MASKASAEGNPDLLVSYLLRLNRISIDKTKSFQQLADVYTWMGKPELAVQALENKLALEPDDDQALLALAELYQILDKPEELTRVLDLRLRKRPGDKKLAAYLASQYSMLGNFKREISLRTTMVEHNPKDAVNILRLGELFLVNRQPREGLELFGSLLKKYPDNPVLADAAVAMAVSHASKHEWHKIKQAIYKAKGAYYNAVDPVIANALDSDRATFGAWIISDMVMEHPEDMDVLDEAIAMYHKNDETLGAVALMERMSRAAPDNLGLVKRLSALYLEANNIPGAFGAFKRLVQLEPESQEAWSQFLKVAGWVADKDDQIEAYAMRVQKFPSDRAAIQQLLKLGREAGRPRVIKQAPAQPGQAGKYARA